MNAKLIRWSSFAVAALLLLGGPGLVLAGEGDEEAASLTGCLAQADEGAFVLQSGDTSVALYGEGLDAHLGHTVKVTGEWAEDADGEKYFAVAAVESLSESCEAEA